MKEEHNDYEEDNNIVELIDDEGNTLRYEHLLTFQYRDEWYVALAPEEEAEASDDEDDGVEIAIYRITGSEEDERLGPIEDEALLDEVFAEFCSQYEDFEDADEAARLDSDEDDGE